MEPQLLHRISDERCISLIGMAAAGKSTLAGLLAQRLGWACLDTDRLLEATEGRALADLLADLGREAFLRLEETVVAGLNVRRCVIATGGSVIYGARAMARLRESGPVVHVAIDLPTFLRRVGDPGKRAFIAPEGLSLADVYAERQPLYAAAADVTISSCGITPQSCIDQILEKIRL